MTSRCSIHGLVGLMVSVALGCSEESVAGVERHVDASSQAIRAAVHSNAALASKLAGAFRDQPGNLLYSPLSIEAVSGILLAAAGGDTAKQLAALLDAEDDPTALHQGLGSLLRDLSRQHPQYTLSVANRLWAEPGLESSKEFTSTTRDDCTNLRRARLRTLEPRRTGRNAEEDRTHARRTSSERRDARGARQYLRHARLAV